LSLCWRPVEPESAASKTRRLRHDDVRPAELVLTTPAACAPQHSPKKAAPFHRPRSLLRVQAHRNAGGGLHWLGLGAAAPRSRGGGSRSPSCGGGGGLPCVASHTAHGRPAELPRRHRGHHCGRVRHCCPSCGGMVYASLPVWRCPALTRTRVHRRSRGTHRLTAGEYWPAPSVGSSRLEASVRQKGR
jgi:hypothetical protein